MSHERSLQMSPAMSKFEQFFERAMQGSEFQREVVHDRCQPRRPGSTTVKVCLSSS